jgi:hypothetical protein
MGHIGGAHRVPIASRARERRKITIREYGFSQHSTTCGEKIDRLGLRPTYLRRLFFHGTSSIFKAQNTGNLCNWHGKIIEDDEDVGEADNSPNQ